MLNKTQDIEAVRKALEDCKSFLNEMEYPELQGAGIALTGGLQYQVNATDEDGGIEYTPDNIYEALKAKVDTGENGSDEEFGDSYTKTIVAVHMLFGIHEYHKFLMWFMEKAQEGFDYSLPDETSIVEKEK